MNRFFIIAFCCLFVYGQRYGLDKKSLINKELPIDITADTLEYSSDANIAVFKGHVVAKQGDLLMRADVVEAIYDQEGNLTTIKARGNIYVEKTQTEDVAPDPKKDLKKNPKKVNRGPIVVTAKFATFQNMERTIILTGAPQVNQNGSLLLGEKITLYVDEDRFLVENAKGRLKIKEEMQEKAVP